MVQSELVLLRLRSFQGELGGGGGGEEGRKGDGGWVDLDVVNGRGLSNVSLFACETGDQPSWHVSGLIPHTAAGTAAVCNSFGRG